ncbi:MAG: AmmeMemoRadiSam system protein A [Lachnospiraceae bacterium]|nr:AmmeMemoRadiSam system protein A [Lachnospiraceae bacterium]
MSILAAFMVPHPPMIVPAVGRGSESQIRETTAAYEKTAEKIAQIAPETIIISSPHSVMYTDYFHISPGKEASGSFSDFRAGDVRFHETYDTELVKEIVNAADRAGFPAGTEGERSRKLDHGTMVPLWFIRQKYDGFRIVRIGLSGLPLTDHYAFGQMIRDAVERCGRKVVYIASGDLSHKLQSYGPYGFAPEGPAYDSRIMDVCGRAAFGELFDFDETFCEKAAECGHRSFVMMAGALDGMDVRAETLSHQDVTGVGYGICTFEVTGENPDRHFLDSYLAKQESRLREQEAQSDAYVKLARKSAESFVKTGRYLPLPSRKELPEEMFSERAGVFVSVHKHGKLRGCIGTFLPVTDCIAKEIIDNAVSAVSRDPRFDPVTADELPWLEINVDVLSTPERIRSKDELDVKRYGVIVSSGRKRGLLLPDLDGVDTVEQQIDIARQKAGIRRGEPLTLERFEVVRHR